MIPTAGTNIERLERCLNALLQAGGGEVDPIIVVCPGPASADLAAMVRGRAVIISLPAPFNYCASINVGLRAGRDAFADIGYTLILNDDAYFAGAGDLLRLRDTLCREGWAAVGPWLDGPGHLAQSVRPSGAVRQEAPLVGACVLWDDARLQAIGGLDESYGLGWGLDEADLSLRALRRGAVWGLDGAVAVTHDHHGTFGDQYTDPQGPAHRRNIALWYERNPGVHPWGKSHHWQPLPGLTVAVAGHSVAPWIERALRSTAAALKGYRWVIAYADDGSTDESLAIVEEVAPTLGADRVIISRHEAGGSASVAKNRAIRQALPYMDRYPALCLMDADDVMAEDRVRHVLYQVRDAGALWGNGAFQYVAPGNPARDGMVLQPEFGQQEHGWLHPCSTIIHRSLIPADGALFDESMPICEDAWLWLHWWLRGYHALPCPGPVTHYYHLRQGSVMLSGDSALRKRVFEERRHRLMVGEEPLQGVALDG